VTVGQAYEPDLAGASILLGPVAQATKMTGKLASVRPAAEGDVPGPGSQIAVLDITAQGRGLRGQIGTHALVDFRFEPSSPGSDGVTVAPGFVARVRLAEESTAVLAAGGDRLRRYFRRELVYERRVDDPGDPIALPASPPSPTVENSWLVYADPLGRFRFRHPQQLRVVETADPKRPEVALAHDDLIEGTSERIALSVVAQSDLRSLEALREAMRGAWKKQQIRVQEGAMGALPTENWPPGMRVGRIEAVVTPPGPDAQGNPVVPVHFLGYTLQTGQNVGLFVKAETNAADSSALREEVEAILRTVELTPGGGVGATGVEEAPVGVEPLSPPPGTSSGAVPVPGGATGGALGLPPSSPGTP
jgi:hypothetical protein